MATPQDHFDRLVGLLRENLQVVDSDIGRLAEQHRLEILRLDICQRRLEAAAGKRALQLLQPSLGAAIGATVDLPADSPASKAEHEPPGAPGAAGEFSDLRPPHSPARPEAPAGPGPKLLDRCLDLPGAVKEESPRGVSFRSHGSGGEGALNEVLPAARAGYSVDLSHRDSCVQPQWALNDAPEKAGQGLDAGQARASVPAWVKATDSDETGQRHDHDIEQTFFRRGLRQRVMHSVHVNNQDKDALRTSGLSVGEMFTDVVDHLRARRGCLPDSVEMKERVRCAVTKPAFVVTSLYHDTGCAQAIARSSWFESLTLLVTFFNAVWIGIEIDGNTSAFLFEADAIYQVGEQVFTIIFVSEWCILFLAFRRKMWCLRDAWFITDSFLALLMVLDTWVVTVVAGILGSTSGVFLSDASILRLVKIARLARLARMSKLLRAFPELVVVIRGIGVAVRAVFFTLCLQLVIVYVFSVALRRLTENTALEESHFPSVRQSMKTLFMHGILPDHSPLIDELGQVHAALGIVCTLFILLASITVMNFIVGVLVEVVKVTSSVEREHGQVSYVKRQMHQMLKEIGIADDEEHYMSLDDFRSVLLHPRTATYMSEMGVDVVGLVDFTDVLFRGGKHIQMSEFFRLVLSLRGSNSTTVKDFVDLRYFLVLELRDLEETLGKQVEAAARRGLSQFQRDTC